MQLCQSDILSETLLQEFNWLEINVTIAIALLFAMLYTHTHTPPHADIQA